MKEVNYTKKSIKLLNNIVSLYPAHSIGQHIILAFDDYNFIGISDKAFYLNLKDYLGTLESDNSPENINQIINRRMDIDSILEKNDEY